MRPDAQPQREVPMPFGPTWSAGTRERVGRLYLTTGLSLREIAAETGVPAKTVWGWAERYGWRLPRGAGPADGPRVKRTGAELERLLQAPARARAGPAAAPVDSESPAGEDVASAPDGAGDLASRLEAVAARAVASLEATVAAGRAIDPERAAKALASLTQTLKIIAGLKGPARDGEGEDREPPPRPLAELLAELEEHRRRLRAERRARRGAGGVQPP